jgi:hypothetical protein
LMEKSPEKIQLRRSWISTGKIIQKTKDNLCVVRQFWGARATNKRQDISTLHCPTSEFRFICGALWFLVSAALRF